MKVSSKTYDRETALEAAKAVFWKKGFHLTSLKDLEAVMEMKPGSIYAAFSSKEALFHLSLERYFKEDCEVILKSLNAPASPISALADHLRTTARSDRNVPSSLCMLVKTLASEVSPETPNARKAQYYLDLLQTEFAELFEKAQNLGELAPSLNPKSLALRFQSCLTALKFELHRGTPRKDILELADDMAAQFEDMRLRDKPASEV